MHTARTNTLTTTRRCSFLASHLSGGIGQNLPQEAPAAFAQAVIDVTRL